MRSASVCAWRGGSANADAARLIAVREAAPFASLEDLADRTVLSRAALEHLAAADAFQDFGLDRRQALWAIRGLADGALPLFAARAAGGARAGGDARPHDSAARGRGRLPQHGPFLARPSCLLPAGGTRGAADIRPCSALRQVRDGRRVTLSGLVLVRQRPGSARGVTFVTIEDETGFANLVVWPDLFEANRPVILAARLLGVRGRLQKEGEVIHVVAERVENLSALLDSLSAEQPHQDSPRRERGLRVPTRDFR